MGTADVAPQDVVETDTGWGALVWESLETSKTLQRNLLPVGTAESTGEGEVAVGPRVGL